MVFEVLRNLECPVGISQREICAHFNEEKMAQFGRSAEKQLSSYAVFLVFLVGRK